MFSWKNIYAIFVKVYEVHEDKKVRHIYCNSSIYVVTIHILIII